MKIGILTFHNAYNYGAVLQTYATQVLLSGLGYDVEIINYHNHYIDEAYEHFKLKFRGIAKKAFKEIVISTIISIFEKRKERKFLCFQDRYLNLSKSVYFADEGVLPAYHAVLIGSDQVWNPKLTGGFDKFYWGDIQGPDKIIAWAASTKETAFTAADKNIIANFLDNFHAISVREKSLKEFLSPLTTKPIHVVLDPTLLLEGNIWRKMCKPVAEKHFIVVYALGDEQEVTMVARKFATSQELQLIVLNPLPNAKIQKGYKQTAGPIEFLSYINAAEYVVVASFHGTAFSLLFNKQFFCFIKDGHTNVRVESILEQVGLRNRIISETSTFDHMEKINYNEVNDKLENLRGETLSFLTSSLK